jgi:hypothetical protein
MGEGERRGRDEWREETEEKERQEGEEGKRKRDLNMKRFGPMENSEDGRDNWPVPLGGWSWDEIQAWLHAEAHAQLEREEARREREEARREREEARRRRREAAQQRFARAAYLAEWPRIRREVAAGDGGLGARARRGCRCGPGRARV